MRKVRRSDCDEVLALTGGCTAQFRGGDGYARSPDHAATTVGTDKAV
ncbi:hypothetical protein [Streptomyces caatingaensis]|nr:hypothetical protein [Streptomyces caatingaensis]